MALRSPWLIAVWPGMGSVALSAGYYLMSKLDMRQLLEFDARQYFDVDHVEVKDGLITAGALPRSRLFVWEDPKGEHDLVLFLGEAQPPLGRQAFCELLIEHARELGVERVFTFAAMATPMHPEGEARVFGATTDGEGLRELQGLGLDLLEAGRISGLNGVLLGAAAHAGLRGTCLLGEMPHIFMQLPFPKASLVVLRTFTRMAGIDLDLAELEEQAAAMDVKLAHLLSQVEGAMGGRRGEEEEPESFVPEPEPAEEARDPAEVARIESLFEEAARDRSKAYELKRELDRLGRFREYEDRFLDLFKRPDEGHA